MSGDELTAAQAATLTASVDIDAPPPDGEPVALVLFGTNQAAPARIAAARYRSGAAPLIIATGGINRHDGVVEGRAFARQLAGAGVPGSVIRVEDQSKDTWQNVELSMPYLREAMAMGLPLVAVSKWYHLRAVYCLRTLLPEAVPLYAIGWEPVYAGSLVTRDNWPSSPDGRRRVIRESREVPRRVAEGSYRAAVKKNGTWWLPLAPGGHRGQPVGSVSRVPNAWTPSPVDDRRGRSRAVARACARSGSRQAAGPTRTSRGRRCSTGSGACRAGGSGAGAPGHLLSDARPARQRSR